MKSPRECSTVNPCRKCESPLTCNKSCEKLDQFLGLIEVGSFGVANSADEIGYKLLSQ